MPLPPQPIPTPRPVPPTPEPAPLPTAAVLHALAEATDRLLATVDAMAAEDFAAPSLLPDWSRAQLLAHLALNAKGLTSVLTTLANGRPIPMYASDRRRAQDIDRLAAQEPARIADRVAVGASMLAQHLGGGPTPEKALETVGAAGQLSADLARARRFRADPDDPGSAEPGRLGAAGAAGAGGADIAGSDAGAGGAAAALRAWGRAVIPAFADAADAAADTIATWSMAGTFERTPGGQVRRAADIPAMRWREVEIHHADLDLGYGPGDWPAPFAEYLLALAAGDRAGQASMTIRAEGFAPIVVTGPDGDDDIEISGSAADLAWWLVGRGDGSELAVAGGALPDLIPWHPR